MFPVLIKTSGAATSEAIARCRRVLNHPEVALGRDRWRPTIVGEESHIIVGSVEIGPVKDVKCVGPGTLMQVFRDGELFRRAHVKLHLERRTEHVRRVVPKSDP
jgi:hypothetical protein